MQHIGGAHQHHRPYGRHREERKSAVDRDAQPAEDPLPNYGADQPQHDIGDDAVALAAHQLARQPSGDKPDYDCAEYVHLSAPLIFPPPPLRGLPAQLLLLFHWGAATLQLTAAAFGHDYLRT